MFFSLLFVHFLVSYFYSSYSNTHKTSLADTFCHSGIYHSFTEASTISRPQVFSSEVTKGQKACHAWWSKSLAFACSKMFAKSRRQTDSVSVDLFSLGPSGSGTPGLVVRPISTVSSTSCFWPLGLKFMNQTRFIFDQIYNIYLLAVKPGSHWCFRARNMVLRALGTVKP